MGESGPSSPLLHKSVSVRRSYGSLNDTLNVGHRRSSWGKRRSSRDHAGEDELSGFVHRLSRSDTKEHDSAGIRSGAMPRLSGDSSKLGTFSGVFVPTTLNVISILMFLRFGLILGQSGLLGMMTMLIAAYLINLVTTLSISAVATNGTVRLGGVYYLLSRSLGPEFGGSIGIVFYLGLVLNTAMNAVGLVDCLKQNFGSESGNWAVWLPESLAWDYLWATILLIVCTVICLGGSSFFARASNGLLIILLLATFSIPFSSLILRPFRDASLHIDFTGWKLETLRANFYPQFTKHAAGSQLRGRETFQDLFGILFPATGGIFAGASMSGDLKHPSKAIPKGTLSGLALTFMAYTTVIVSMAATITRDSFYKNSNIVQETNVSGVLILMGEIASTSFSVLMGVIGAAKLLQALARDELIPGLSIFARGSKTSDEPILAILMTYCVAQISMLAAINQIASFVTMTYLMTFLATNLACFLLRISSAPNFRPSFRYFNGKTAALGTVISGASMFFVDGIYATLCVGILVSLFLVIHYTTPPKSWGEVTQSLIYHQVRKYLLRLRSEHVKYWRPQILLLVNDPRRQYKLIQFCNALKKGALFILGHVIVSDDFAAAVPEARKQQAAWTKYIELSRIKAFVTVAIAPTLEFGASNAALNAGLGGMRPNIVVLGAYNLDIFRLRRPSFHVPSPQQSPPITRRGTVAGDAPTAWKRRDSRTIRMEGELPTDVNRSESDINPSSWVTILEDMMFRLRLNVAVAKGIREMDFPHRDDPSRKRYIDLWPLQMAAEIQTGERGALQNILTTNFDTYALILQLGAILETVPDWRRACTLRVAVFVEYESDVEEERQRVQALLTNLRISAEVLVFWLARGDVASYEVIVNGARGVFLDVESTIDQVLEHDDWWNDLQDELDQSQMQRSPSEEAASPTEIRDSTPERTSIVAHVPRDSDDMAGLRRVLRQAARRRSSGNVSGLAAIQSRMSMTTSRLQADMVYQHAAVASASEDSEESSSDSDSEIEPLTRINADVTNAVEDSSSDDQETGLLLSPASRKTKGASPSDQRSATIGAQVTSQEKSSGSISPTAASPKARPRFTRTHTGARFSSHPVPHAAISQDDGPGPSITFTDTIDSRTKPDHSIYDRKPTTAAAAKTAPGFPASRSVPLSFNNIGCRAQHLIINELMRKHSSDTAVVFTTLPGPLEGTGQSEEDSVAYLSDLEVLTEGLPPVLLVHSNSITVTTNL